MSRKTTIRLRTAAMQTQSTKSLRPAQAAEFLGISHATLWRWLKERPDFPRPRKIGARTTIWIAAELEQWRDAQAHQSSSRNR